MTNNPLVAERQDSTEGYSGITLLESAHDTSDAIASGTGRLGVLGADRRVGVTACPAFPAPRWRSAPGRCDC